MRYQLLAQDNRQSLPDERAGHETLIVLNSSARTYGTISRLSAALATALLLLALPSVSVAKDEPLARGIDPVSAKLAISLDNFLSVEGARTSPKSSYKLELALDFASGLMALKVGDDKVDNLIRNRLDLHLSGSWAFTDWAEAAIDIPVTVYQSNGFAELRDLTGFQAQSPSSAGFGDIRALGKFRLLKEERAFVTVAAIGEIRIPTGADQSFLGERSVMLSPKLSIERTFIERLRIGLEGSYRYRPLPGRYINLHVGDEFTLALAASFKLPKKVFNNWAAYGELLTATPARSPLNTDSDALKTPLELLLGLRAEVHPNIWVTVGGGTGIAGESRFGRESFRLFGSIRYQRVFKDRDGDGIPDDVDKCPDDPEDKDGFQDEDGCPDPDNDGDGIPDVEDKCPDKPGPKKNHGCPEPELDTDKDGIPDKDDRCPKEPGPASNHGCPESNIDTDKDGVPDKDDRCPKEPGPKSYDGCPDTDGDEVPDIDDKCPKEAGPASNRGCPIKTAPVVFEQGKLVLKDSIRFDTDRATIKPNSLHILVEVVKILKAHPEIKRLKIEGHTDNIGSAAYNKDLSQRRAQAIVDFLVKNGIAKTKLSAEGYGFDRPIAPNATALGRAINRRVEFAVTE